MASSVTCRSVVRAGEVVRVRWTDGIELEYASIADMRRAIRDVLEDEAAKDFLRAIAIAKLLKAAPDGSTLPSLVNRTCTFDLSLANNIVRYT